MTDVKNHLMKYLNANKRFENRGLLDYREIFVETGVSLNAEGSARVKIGGTEVIAGVKLALEKPYPDTPDKGSLMIGAEFLPMANPAFESGPPGIESIEVARVVDRGIRESESIDTKELCVEVGEKVWIVMVDVCTINDEGNLMDASGLAAIAAIKTAVFPSVNENGVVDYKNKTDKKLPISKTPIPITVHKIGKHLIVDPNLEEQKVSEARLTITSTEDGKLSALQKGGDYPLTVEDIAEMIKIASEKSNELRATLG